VDHRGPGAHEEAAPPAGGQAEVVIPAGEGIVRAADLRKAGGIELAVAAPQEDLDVFVQLIPLIAREGVGVGQLGQLHRPELPDAPEGPVLVSKHGAPHGDAVDGAAADGPALPVLEIGVAAREAHPLGAALGRRHIDIVQGVPGDLI